MELHPGQPDNAYTAVQLELMGCGNDSSIRRRYFIKQGGLFSDDQLIPFTVKNKATSLIPFDLLTSEDQDKVIYYRAAELVAARKAAEKSPTSPPERPKLTSPAALAGAEAARKLKEQEAQAIEDAQQRRLQYMAMFMELPEKSRQAAEAKQKILDALDHFLMVGNHKGRVKNGKQCWNWKGVQKFCAAFIETGLNLPSDVSEQFVHKGKRSLVPASLNNWREKYAEMGLYGLADHYTSRKGVTILTIPQQEFCVSMFIEKQGVSVQTICKAMTARFKGEELPNRTTIGRFLENWKAGHESLYLYLTNPDAWKSKYQFAFGDSAENVTRLNQMWQSDSTKADLLTQDGRVVIVGIIDVWSRRLKLLVSPTSKSIAIGMLLRRCILDWGMLEEEFRTDNGSDFTSYYLERVLDSLDVHHHLCDPFTPEQKPMIERVFKTFSWGIVPLLDGYVGHCVADRKAIESRKSFAKKLMTKGETVEVNMTAAELQTICDRWCDAMYSNEPHRGLDGMTPAAKARSWTAPIKRISNERALDVLLSPAPSNDGCRIITKKGCEVTFGLAKLWYKAAEFAGHEGERVRVLIDATDLGHATIFQADGAFLCVAEDPEWLGISNAELASHTKQRQKALLAESRRNHKEMVKRAKIDGIAEEILQAREEQAAKIAEFPKRSTEYTTPALEQAAIAVDERQRRAANPALNGIMELSPEVLESEERERQRVIKFAQRQTPMMFADQFEIAEYVRKRTAKGEADEVETEWLNTYDHYVTTGKHTGRFQADPYLLKHWQQSVQAVGQ